jgi:uncharacterized protein (TIGR02145 family)
MKTITLLLLMIISIAITSAQNYQILFAGTGASTTVDSVLVENISQCIGINLSGSDTLYLSPTVGIDETNMSTDQDLNVYPNPMTGNCLIDFKAISEGTAFFELFDITGKKIWQIQDFLTKGFHRFCLSGISTGVYILKIETDKYSCMTKIISTESANRTIEINQIESTILPYEQIPDFYTGKIKNDKSIMGLQYNTGDILMLTGKSGIYSTVFMLVPNVNQTVTFNFVACTDADGNNYSVIQIGTQMWMAENLKTTHYRNGNPIPNITDSIQWCALTSGAYCNYNNDTNIANFYGRLYNWYAVNDSRNIAPLGWHVSTNSDWNKMGKFVEPTLDTLDDGFITTDLIIKIKENCDSLWTSPATNISGFSALPGGIRDDNNNNGMFLGLVSCAAWWTATQYYPGQAWFRVIDNSFGYYYGAINNPHGHGVRCVKD